jgi:hypothetical protein
MIILRSHKNGFIDIIKGKGLDVNIFRQEEKAEDEEHKFIISATGTPFKFTVLIARNDIKKLQCKYTLLSPALQESAFQRDPNQTIDYVYRKFDDWLDNHVITYLDEIIVPDLWAQIEEQEGFFENGGADADEYTLFSQEEQLKIRKDIESFKLLIQKDFSPSDDVQKIINDKLDYLVSGVERLHRIDWKNVAFSTIISIATALALDIEKTKYLFELFKKACGVVWQLPGN